MGMFGSIFGCLVCMGVIAVSIWLSIYYLGDRDSLPEQLPELPEDLRDYLPDIELFHKEDPFSNVNPSDANRWPNDGSGLDLQLINALDTMWYDYFDLAVQEWDNGSPDALTLTTEVASPESECSSVDGVMKVCNGDYGETDWKGTTWRIFLCTVTALTYSVLTLIIVAKLLGINTILMSSGWITTSSARMNDHFFVEGDDAEKRQYTMCHEVRFKKGNNYLAVKNLLTNFHLHPLC